jgi:predicted transposase YdaD
MLKRLAQAHPLQQCLAVQFDTGACCDLNTGVLILGSNVRKTLKQKKNDADLHLEFRSRYLKLRFHERKQTNRVAKLTL